MTTVTCPIVPWYEFKHCEIKTCKNHTGETKHRCLEIDRKKPEGTKQFSDAELNLYKFKHRGISTRLVQMKRKDAIQNVKSILVLKRFIEWLEENFQPKPGFRMDPGMRKLEKEYPLKIKRLGWKNWMWAYALDNTAWETFCKREGGECATFNVYQLLGIKLGRYENLLQSTKKETQP